jgi:MFS family permease
MPLFDYSYLATILSKPKFKKSFKKAKQSYLNRIRWATSLFFFGMGLCFASWASRIPDIKSMLHLSEGDLGSVLFALPVGQLLGMNFSGKTIAKYGSHRILIIAMLGYLICLTNLGLASQTWHLVLGLFLFGFCGNFCNISVNTQGVYTEKLFNKPLMGSFHGSWSLAGFCGALIGLVIISFGLSPHKHFLIVAAIVLIIMVTNYKYLIKVKRKSHTTEVAEAPKKRFQLPEKSLLLLGVIGFCCMASEGIMFDWSGVYFKDVVKAPSSMVILGYTSFMITMASGRFLSDYLVMRYGSKKVVFLSGMLISTGLYLAVIFPYMIPCILAFMLVGFGVSNVVPIVYSIAGKNTKVAPSIALTMVSSVSFLGFLIGPPIIGYIAELTNLKYSFAFVGLFGILITIMVSTINLGLTTKEAVK